MGVYKEGKNWKVQVYYKDWQGNRKRKQNVAFGPREKQKSGRGISFSSRRRVLRSSLVISLSYITKIWKSACVKIPCTQNVISLI